MPDYSSERRKEEIARMFDSIVERYEFLNHLFSFNRDRMWRKETVKYAFGRVLDIACGSGEMVELLLENPRVEYVVGLDLSWQMLEYARRKRNFPRSAYIMGDAENLPFEDETFNSITIAFGIRNFPDKLKSLKEIHRVLRRGGRVLIVDMVGAEGIFRPFYDFYKERVMPFVARFFTSNWKAYKYLSTSIDAFPPRDEFKSMMREAGFVNVWHRDFTFGAATLFYGEKLSD